MKRRRFLLWTPAVWFATQRPAAWASAPDFPQVTSGQPLKFPRDYGAHPGYRIEWWYVTGWLETETGAAVPAPLGFEATFFRARPALNEANPEANPKANPEANPSRFAPSQLLFANVALSDPRAGRLLYEQRAARRGFGLVEASETDTDVRIDAWSLARRPDRRYRLIVDTPGFSFDFTLTATQPTLVNGVGGYSRKGPRPDEASYYYSEPWLQVGGVLKRGDSAGYEAEVRGRAWLDHEWSSAPLNETAVGWDWIGIDLDGGGALMAYQIRDKAGRKFWAGGTLRSADGSTRTLAPESVRFMPLRWWRSPHTGAHYPVAMRVDAADQHLTLVPLMDDQEFDSRASTGAVYWEGAVTALQAGSGPATQPAAAARTLGLGYLELTGYVERLELD